MSPQPPPTGPLPPGPAWPAAGARFLVEGPRWAGMWTEIVADALRELGGETAIHHHNVKPVPLRLLGGLARALPRGRAAAGGIVRRRQRRHSNRELVRLAARFRPDWLISIQGKIDPATVAELRAVSPRLRVVFWWGDILTDHGRERIAEMAKVANRILFSYLGDGEELARQGIPNLAYFPFGFSPRFHTGFAVSEADRRRYAADVAFVGTAYPDRARLLAELGRRLGFPVRVWGRGWRRHRGVAWQGAVCLADSLKVHALSRISLNIHHPETRNGLNMKAYEIPAAGGFEICDPQPLLRDIPLGRHVPTFEDVDDLARQVRHFLAHEAERKGTALLAHEAVIEHHRYAPGLAALLGDLGGV